MLSPDATNSTPDSPVGVICFVMAVDAITIGFLSRPQINGHRAPRTPPPPLFPSCPCRCSPLSVSLQWRLGTDGAITFLLTVQVYVCGGTKLSTITSVPSLLRRRFLLLTTFPVEMPHGRSERQMAKCVPPVRRTQLTVIALP